MSDAGDPRSNPRLAIARPDPEDRNAGAADRLMHAVVCLLIERGTPLLADALKPEEVTKRAGKSRASYYRTDGFPASEANNHEARLSVLERVLERVLDGSAADTAQVVGGIGAYLDSGWAADSPREFVRSISEANFDHMSDHTLMIQLLAAVCSPSSVAMEGALTQYYGTVTDAYVEAYHQIFRFWGYRPKPPLTLEKFTMILMGLAEGLMLRYLGNAGVDRVSFGEAISTVATALVVADGDVAQQNVPPEHDLPGEVAPPNRAAIVATLVRLFEQERASLPTVEELARAAGCTPQTIRSRFGGVLGVIEAAWDEWVPEFEEEAQRNHRLLQEPSPMTVLYRVAVAVATRAAEQRSVTRALLMSEIGIDPHNATTREEPISRLFERLLGEAASMNDFRAPAFHGDESAPDRYRQFARVLRNNLLSVVLTQPVPAGTTAAEHARSCVDYVWALLVPPRRSMP
jgi:AcrR family transcriptional regulator